MLVTSRMFQSIVKVFLLKCVEVHVMRHSSDVS